MIGLPFSMVLKSVIFCMLAGAAFGAVYSFAHFLPIGVKRIFLRNKNTFVSQREIHFYKYSSLFDFLFFTVVGIVYILINYATCDGVMTFYPLFFLILTFVTVCAVLARILKI